MLHVPSFTCPVGLGKPWPRSVPALVGPFASTGVGNTDAYLEAALILGHPPRDLPLHGAGAPWHAIAASLERLAETWAEHHR